MVVLVCFVILLMIVVLIELVYNILLKKQCHSQEIKIRLLENLIDGIKVEYEKNSDNRRFTRSGEPDRE